MFGITSWKTTALGGLSILGAIVDVGNVFLGNGSPDHLGVDFGAIMGGIGLMFAKDHNVSNAPTPVTAKPIPPVG